MTSSLMHDPPPKLSEAAAVIVRGIAMVIKGLVTELPGLQNVFCDRNSGGATQSAAYCYGVWLKHLVLACKHGMAGVPRTVLELGPGNSLGTGFAALLSGAESYIGIDSMRHADPRTNAEVLRGLVALFGARAPRPRKGWPDYDDCLDARLFPGAILTDEKLIQAPERLRALQRAAEQPGEGNMVHYATWRDPLPASDGEVDFIFSHVALCCIQDLGAVYRQCARWLKPGGWMSHQTNFSSMGSTPEWNGHLRYSSRLWKRMAGRRPTFASQLTCSSHLRLMRESGFEVLEVFHGMRHDGLPRSALADEWRSLPDHDLQCSDALLIARKPA